MQQRTYPRAEQQHACSLRRQEEQAEEVQLYGPAGSSDETVLEAAVAGNEQYVRCQAEHH